MQHKHRPNEALWKRTMAIPYLIRIEGDCLGIVLITLKLTLINCGIFRGIFKTQSNI